MYPQVQKLLLFIAVIMFGLGTLIQIAENKHQPGLAVDYRPLNNPGDIAPLLQPVQAIAYTSVISLAELPVKEKKQRFTEMLLPAILISKQKLQTQRHKLEQLLSNNSLNADQQDWLTSTMQRYKAKTPDQLKQRMINLPNSMILAQAAIETGWGSSRFFVQANNIFGVWSFDPTEPRIKAHGGRNGTPVYLKRYPSLLESIDDYQLTLGRGQPYRQLRQATRSTQNSLQLITYLDRYSELGQTYINRLAAVIKHNKLQQYDDYHLRLN
ncbi:glucosaminidase domain-containing protein [Amphritea balenae]|uniref:Mannosyl-glycoprotein endo-beta-N-acetylglucosamidase-like domain-containing protein n=1 Tax=Amphritea balenae TaxID=452629 RepID=A0A3P1SMZ8_9GAMM|nr:glucosaminidase domain-containing protein [Amphritea balenae]RRC98583.1 hypothetical protein EHS89_13300 [Amphritea balenae]GGK65716.1 Bax protein [Amphritea balenae]